MTDKRTLRTAARTARAAFVARGKPEIAAPAEFLTLLSATPAKGTLATYAPLGDEADPAPLARAAIAAGWTLALPHVIDRATPLRFLAWHPEDALAAGPFGLSQPEPHAAEVEPAIILTPLVAFDAALNRIGQGAGHYDRAFAARPRARRIGIAFSVQQAPAIAADPWDMPLDAIVTETGWISR
ncbi:5-formyltetrahydrofolate cyclo-ligase [Sphingomonas sp.]|uniref:5-formyltetrahydrofolate cyclo-ligase n=1 Tax=Sphingomonas sp. TaxID=28214 RepID=UPI0035C7ABF9